MKQANRNTLNIYQFMYSTLKKNISTAQLNNIIKNKEAKNMVISKILKKNVVVIIYILMKSLVGFLLYSELLI